MTTITTHRDFAAFILALGDFLEALDMDGYFLNRGEKVPQQPT